MTGGPDVPFEDTLNVPRVHDALEEARGAIVKAQDLVSRLVVSMPEGDSRRGMMLYAQKKLDDAEIDVACPLRIITGWRP